MKKIILFLSVVLFACAPAPTPKVILITVVVPPSVQPVTPTLLPTQEITPSATANPCFLWSEVTAEMAGQTLCVRGLIRKIDVSKKIVHWDFSDNNTGFFAISNYLGWHPETGKDMSVGDCVAITGLVQSLSTGRPYIFWGEVSILKSTVDGKNKYYEHPDLQVIEDNPSFCQ